MTDRLIRLRDRAHNQMLHIMKFAETVTEATNLEEIITRLDVLESKYQAFNDTEIQLYENPNYEPITETVDSLYYKTRALLSKFSSHNARDTNRNLNTTLEQFIDQQKTFYEGVNTSQHVRLPKVNIEQFSGDYKHWASFYDLFRTTVHNNQHISDVHKFQMLKGLLSGEAAALIRHIAITENNYGEAWDKLCSRYNKMTPIVTSLIQSFCDQKPSLGTGRDLRRITETADEIIRALRALGPNAETRDPWLIHILLSKIDSESKQLWANESVDKEFPSFEYLLKFLNRRCDALEICDASTKKISAKVPTKSFFSANSNSALKCISCEQNHPLFKCPLFKNKNVDERTRLVTERSLCRNCLRSGHLSTKCYTKFTCLICSKRHHTLLHQVETQSESRQASTSHHIVTNNQVNETIETASTTKSINKQTSSDESQNNLQVYTLYSSPTTVLPTALVYVRSRTGELQSIRALLDSGSQTSFVTENCAQRLGLKRSSSSMSIYGLASSSTGQTKGKIDMTIHSLIDKHYNLKVTAHIIDNITNILPTKLINFNKEVMDLKLADPLFYQPHKIDLLLGADVFFEILNPEQRVVDGFPKLQYSKFGWLIAGVCSKDFSNAINLHITNDPIIQITTNDHHQLLNKMREVQEVVPQANFDVPKISHDRTTTREARSRFIIKQPFKEPTTSLGRSFEAAQQRLQPMEGLMLHLPREKVPPKDDARCFLPHPIVIKPGNWPNSKTVPVCTDVERVEASTKYVNVLAATATDDIAETRLNKFSSSFKIKKIMVYVLRTRSHRTHYHNQHCNKITPAATNEAEAVLHRNTQNLSFNTDLHITRKNCPFPAKTPLSSLHPFIHSAGLLRIRDQLNNSSLSYSTKHPVILPKLHKICHLVTRKILTVYIRYRNHKVQHKKADQPAVRCTQGQPFSQVGPDYSGALYIKPSKRKTAPAEKAYVVLFVCLIMKAVHLQIVKGFDTASFLTALKPTIPRRGTPEDIWCDNGSNFICVKRKLQRLKQQIVSQSNNSLITEFLLQKSVRCLFNPSYVPVKSFKYRFKGIINVNGTFEEVTTMVIQIDALLNSRPLCGINDDPADFEMLTPAHFLVRKASTLVPEPSLTEISLKRVSSWQNAQQRCQGCCNRWLCYSLRASQHRYKWKASSIHFKIDGEVYIREYNLHPTQWIPGRATDLHSGSDTHTRSHDKTSKRRVQMSG